MILHRKRKININNLRYNLQESNMNALELMDVIHDMVMLQQIYEAAIKEISTKLDILDDEFNIKHDHNPIYHMESRIKQGPSITKKLENKGLKFSIENSMENLNDIAGVRVICYYLEDIYKIAELLTRQDDIILIEEKDYIKEPKPSGYRSLHLVVKVPVFLAEETKEVPVEVQIRTIGMDFWSSLEHKLKYKNQDLVDEQLRQDLTDCAGVIADIDKKMESIYNTIRFYKDKEA